MAIDQTQLIDFATIDSASGDFWLTISDHLPWDKNETSHLVLLQAKLNAYISFIESGEILSKFPQARGRKLVINLVGKYELTENALSFIELASNAIEQAGLRLQISLNRPN